VLRVRRGSKVKRVCNIFYLPKLQKGVKGWEGKGFNKRRDNSHFKKKTPGRQTVNKDNG